MKKNSKAAKSDNLNQPSLTHAERVSQRAYEIWQACGCPHGCEQEHWLQAERELKEIS